MINKLVVPSCLILFANFYSYPQSGKAPDIDQVAGQFVKMLRADPKEKVYVYTDKWSYLAGEEILFRAYCLNALSDRPIHQSKNLFLDLVNDKDSVISQLLMNIQEGRTGGKVLLPGSLKEGYYWMRAYTTNILREDSNRIFVKPVYILNPRHPDPRALQTIVKSAADPRDTSRPQLLFFAEGGSIISGTTATVAFRFQSPSGKPLDVSGYITDTRDSTVADLKTSLPGMGKFSFDAWNPRKYFAHIKWTNNRELTYPLPHIDQFASQLSLVDQTSQAFHLRVSQGDSLYKKNKSTHILGISRDSLCFAANGTDMYDVNISKNNFPKGKAILFLFDGQGQIVSQRALYMDSGTTRVVALTDKVDYGPREKVKLDISVSSSDNRPVNALFSVSVTDDRFGGLKAEQDSLSGFYSDQVEFPETGSSTATGPEKKYSPEEMDLIMLTQKNLYPGWKYGNEFSTDSPPNNNDDNSFLSIKGVIVSKKNEPLNGYLVNLFGDQKGMFRIDTTDAKGHFQFTLPDYDEGTRFNLKLTNLEGKGQEGKVILENSSFPLFSTPRQLKRRFGHSELEAIRKFKTRLLDTVSRGGDNGSLTPVIVKGEKAEGASYDESKRVSRFSTIITSDKFNNGDNLAVVNAIKNVPGFNAGLVSYSAVSSGVQPMVVMDGVKQTLISGDVKSFLMTVDPMTIDFIEVLKGALTAIYGMEGAGGVILINTSNNRREIAQIDNKGLTAIYPKGYFKESDFSGPDYDKKESKKSSFPDLRSTIYWKGNVLTGANGKVSIEFFTADEATTYTVSLMGVTATGEIICQHTKIIRK